MSDTQARSSAATSDTRTKQIDMQLEVVVLPVSDVDRAAEFYSRLGWRVDADFPSGNGRLLQLTPPGSGCSILFGTGLTPSAPGTSQFLHLVVSDIVAAREELVSRGVDVSEVFHDKTGGFNRFDPRVRASGPDPERRSYASFLTFSDPDGNGWVLQEITTRFAGRIDSDGTTFASAAALANAMRRAEAAHGEYEKRLGSRDEQWPDWYADYMVREQTGVKFPSQATTK
jgi:catechol 2,3-dioxygenase-like lactoylglutathione lyase family enzyme